MYTSWLVAVWLAERIAYCGFNAHVAGLRIALTGAESGIYDLQQPAGGIEGDRQRSVDTSVWFHFIIQSVMAFMS